MPFEESIERINGFLSVGVLYWDLEYAPKFHSSLDIPSGNQTIAMEYPPYPGLTSDDFSSKTSIDHGISHAMFDYTEGYSNLKTCCARTGHIPCIKGEVFSAAAFQYPTISQLCIVACQNTVATYTMKKMFS